jgi:hypothetical protein
VIAVVTVGVAVVIGLGSVVSGAWADPKDSPECSTTVDNPHPSTGAGGAYVIVKARTSCINNISQVRIGVSLWQCPSEPTGSKDTWGSQGCAIVATGARALNNPKNGSQYTTYAPPDGTSGPTESGWYVGSAVTTGYNSLGQNIFVHTSIGNPGFVTPLGGAS